MKKVFKDYAIELYGTSLKEKLLSEEEPSLKHIFDYILSTKIDSIGLEKRF